MSHACTDCGEPCDCTGEGECFHVCPRDIDVDAEQFELEDDYEHDVRVED